MKSDMKYVLFTDESRATLDGPDGWAKGWVINGDQAPERRRRQQGGGAGPSRAGGGVGGGGGCGTPPNNFRQSIQSANCFITTRQL